MTTAINPSLRLKPLAAVIALSLFAASHAYAENQILVNGNTYHDFNTSLATGNFVFLNADNNPANTVLRATQRSLGFREVDYKAKFSETLSLTQVAGSAVSGNTVYDYSAQNNKNTSLVGFWANKDLPIIIGTDSKAYITDGHHTTAGYLAATTPLPREVIAGLGHVVMGHVVANYYNPANGPVDVDNVWWSARQSENNAYLYGPTGNVLAQATDPGYSGLQPISPSTQAMPLIPGEASMTNDDYRSLTWSMADGITFGNKGYSKTNSLAAAPQPDINFVEFYWADFLRNRVMWDNTKSGHALGTTGVNDANLISAPISFFAAVANGTALAKSEAYKDQFGRTLSDYNNASFGTNTQTWAGASLKNGLAKNTNTYELYSLDDSNIKGDITPSEKSTNHLHIDTTAGQSIDGKIQNVASVDINKGSTITTSWKDAVFNNSTSNSTLTVAAGTGDVTFTNTNNYTGTTNVDQGRLIIANGASIANTSAVNVGAKATLVNNGVVGAANGQVTINGSVGGSGVFNSNVTIQNGAHLGPGNSPGTLTFQNGLTLADGSILDFDFGNPADKILVNGGVFQKGVGSNGITVNFHGAAGFNLGDTYTLFDWTGASVIGIDAEIFRIALLPSDTVANFSIVGSTLQMQVNAVPVPSAVWLFGTGLLALVGRRKAITA